MSLSGTLLSLNPTSSSGTPPRIVESVLSQDLWTNRDAYDASHYLMIPLHAAFRTKQRISDRDIFGAFMQRFTVAWSQDEFAVDNIINRLQFLLLVSRYLRYSPSNRLLLDLVTNEHRVLFLETKAPHWSQGDFSSLQRSIEWKLSTPDPDRAYYTSITDAERSVVTLGADLHAILGSSAPNHVIEARDLGLRILRERSTWSENGEWRFQFGSTWDHPDNAYAGHLEVTEDMAPRPIPGLAGDTSHAHRLPAVLEAFIPNGDEPDLRDEVDAMRSGLAKQIVHNCLVLPDQEFRCIRMTNYMDGHNGLYRWNYPTQGAGNGYRPYELSGTFLLGWWSLLDSDEIRDAYELVADCYPLTESEVDLYVGPNTTRERNPVFAWPNAFQPGGAMEYCIRSSLLI